jgi:DNA polymerase I
MRRLFPENNFVPPQVGPSLRLVVAEAPGAEEAEQGKPLVGGSGKIFDSLLRKAKVPRDSLTIINTINCRPPNNVYPTDSAARGYCTEQEAKDAVSHCYRAHVEPLLHSRPWDSILALGDKALRGLTDATGGITKWRGSPLPLKGEDKPKVVATLHPAYLMRDQSMIPVAISDIKKGTQVPPEYYNLRPTVQDVIDFRSKFVCFDLESNRFTGQITMVGLQYKPYHVMVVPFTGRYIDEIKRIFREATHVVGHNITMFDLPKLKDHGVEISQECQIWDTILMQHLLQPDLPHDLEFVSSIFTQKPAWKHLSSEDMPLYCARDTDVTLQSYLQLLPALKAQRLEDLYKYTQVPLAKICALVERTGIHTDGERATKVRQGLLADILELEKLLPKELQPYDKSIRVRKPAPKGTLGKSGKPIRFIHEPGTEKVVPWNSPDRVAEYLYKTLKLPEQINPKSKKVTTDKGALEKLNNKFGKQYPEIAALRKIRSLDELASSFIKGAKDEDGNEIPVKNGKIQPHLSPFGTSQGRLSSSHPNMQNQPPAARFIYVPSDPDWCLVEADFSQGENRLTAWYANDLERLDRLSQSGFSEHKLNAQIFFDIPYESVVKDNSPDAPYGKAKKLTHGINYGEGYRKIAMTLGLPEKDVKEWIGKWRIANAKTVRWMEDTASIAEREGVLTNVFGRKRWFWSSRLYTESLSMLPQSTLADMCFRAMIGLMYERIGWSAENALKVTSVLAPLPLPAKFLLQVHDSLLFECPKALVPEVVKCVKACMEQGFPQMGGFGIPAEFSVGEPSASWGELKSYKVA